MSFSLDLSRAIKKAKGKQELVVKKVMIETFSRCIAKSPVLTGRFRANWSVGIGTKNTSTTETLDKRSVGDRTGPTVDEMKLSISSMSLNGQTIYLTNSLVYATRLERGWSKQAPQGMVQLSLAEIVAHYGT